MNARLVLAWVLVSSLLVGGAASSAEPADKPATLRIAMVGDSTMASYPNPPADRPDLTGWGQVFSEFFTPPVRISNYARSGASSKSFCASDRWTDALAERPHYLFIQFGHNDGPGKGDRSTDPKTEFRDNLRRCIDEAKAVGAETVLVTPVARRIYVDGKIDNQKLQPFVEAVIAVGAEKNVPVIDLNGASTALFNQLGDAGSADFSPSVADRTHFSRKGALAIAKIVADALPAQVPALKPYLK